jgi:hypothetical protein
MSLLKKVKENLKKKEEIVDEVEEEEDILETFVLAHTKWQIAPNMREIRDGNLELIPIECMLIQYILKNGEHCYYCGLMDTDTGDMFDLYEFDWVGEDEDVEPDYREITLSMSAIDSARFLKEKIELGYTIYIPERE